MKNFKDLGWRWQDALDGVVFIAVMVLLLIALAVL